MTVRICAFVLLLWPALTAAATDAWQFAYQQHVGRSIPVHAIFRDETNRRVQLGDLLGGEPVILALGYFHCPNLCGVVRADIVDALSRSGMLSRQDYSLIVVSIDPTETAADAGKARDDDAVRVNLQKPPTGWHYLTGSASDVQKLERDVGFRARYDQRLKMFLHPAGIVLLTPRGTISSYLLGVGYPPGDLRVALTRARQGTVAQAALPVLLLCFHYDPGTGRYSLAIVKLLEIACALTVLALGGTLALAFRRERRT